MSALSQPLEKRSYPRVHLLRPLELVHENGAMVKANLRDISPGGVQAMCDQDTAHVLVPDGRANPWQGPQVFATFNLPVEGELLEVQVDCRMIHLSLVKNEGVAIGLRFVRFRGESLEHLRRFIVCSLEPAY